MKTHKKTLIAVIAVFLVVGIAVMFGVVHAASGGNKILDNVYIDTVNVGGMTKDEAKKVLDDYVAEKQQVKITLTAGKKKKAVTAEDMGVQFKADKAVKKAYGIGRDGNLFKNFFQVCKLKSKSIVVTLNTVISEKQSKTILEKNEKNLIAKTTNASVTRENGEFVIIDEVVGQEIVYDKSAAALKDAVSSWDKKALSVEVSVEKEQPTYTAEDMKDVKDVLGTYTTSYSSSGYNRRRNVENGADKINGTMLYPGEELSVYEIVSPFTSENGYYLAPSYANGEVVETYGGGICQVSTTLYNAVLRSELEITERFPHSMTVHYVPLSADAAIAGTHKDLKFKNNQKTPIYIEGKAGGGTLTFTIYGKETRDENRTIKFESKTLSVKSPSTVETNDPTIEEGKSVVTSSGTTGYTAELWKVVYVDGKETERTKVNSSSYSSSPKKVSIGTKPKATTETPSSSGSSSSTSSSGSSSSGSSYSNRSGSSYSSGSSGSGSSSGSSSGTSSSGSSSSGSDSSDDSGSSQEVTPSEPSEN
jgi:vancomycin resistance protein YoaR